MVSSNILLLVIKLLITSPQGEKVNNICTGNIEYTKH